MIDIQKKDLRKQTIYIQGMHCTSCEIIIAEELRDLDTVQDVKVNRKKQTAEIYYDEQAPGFAEVADKIKKVGYQASLQPNSEPSGKKNVAIEDWVLSIVITFVLYVFYRLFNNAGWLNGVDADTTNITYSIAFLIGIVASLSTCLAVVGAVVISFAAKYEEYSDNFFQANIKPHFLFHAGRLLTFAFLGGILGLIGHWFSLSNIVTGWFTVFISLIMVWLGLNILGLVPSLSTIGIRMPKNSMRVWKNLQTSNHVFAPAILGGFTFFLPCGFTQSMQLFAMSSGNFLTGALTMFLFALGTVPVLLGLGVATTRFKNMRSIIVEQVIGFVVVLFAVYTFSSGLALAGINLDLLNAHTVGTTINNNGDVQTINMVVSYQGFTPNVFHLKKDIPVRWIIDGQQVTGCLNKIIAPNLGIEQELIQGNNIIEFTPNQAGTFGFSCWMGMVRGQFIIE